MTDTIKGHCLCGGVAFEIARSGALDACHCRMCQRWTGGIFIELDVEDGDLAFSSDATLTWYDSSEWARRGFCRTCGSSLFYRMKRDDAKWAVLAGTLDMPSGRTIDEEIFIDQKPDYYDLAGDRSRLTASQAMAKYAGSADD